MLFLGCFGFADGADSGLFITDQDLFHVGPLSAAVRHRLVDRVGDEIVPDGIPVLIQKGIMRVRKTEEFLLNFDDEGIDRNFPEGSLYARARIFFFYIYIFFFI